MFFLPYKNRRIVGTMRILILSHFSASYGPKIFLMEPESINEQSIDQIPKLMDVYEKGFFINISDDLKSINLIFEIPSLFARGKKELLLLSIITDLASEINPDYAKELLESFANVLIKTDKLYLAFYVGNEVHKGNAEKLQELKKSFKDFFISLKSAIKIIKEAEEKRKQLEFIINHSHAVAFLWKNSEGWPIEYVSDNISQFGYNPEEIVSQNMLYTKMVDPTDLERIAQEVKTFSDKNILEFEQEYKILTSSGESRWVHDHTYIRKNSSGKITHYQGLILDITEQRIAEQKLKKSEEKLRENVKELNALYEISKIVEEQEISIDAILQKSVNLIPTALRYSDKACGRISFDTKEYISPNFKETLWKISTHIQINAQLLDVEAYSSQEYNFGNEEIYLLYEIASRLKTILERKQYESKLLESEKNYRFAFDRANFYKDLFTHDIGNILNNTRASIELLTLYENKPELKSKTDDYLKLLKDQTKKGIDLISDIRKLSEVEEIDIETQPIEACKNIKEAVEFLKENYHERIMDINIERIEPPETPCLVRANVLLLDMFDNLLLNAARYCENPIIFIRIAISKEIRENVNYYKFEIKDNAVGIPDDLKKTIFQEYKKSTKKGMGIGLSLVKKIVDSYNGFIWVENRVENDYSKGSNFVVLIPEA